MFAYQSRCVNDLIGPSADEAVLVYEIAHVP
jgi:hypothetical protein